MRILFGVALGLMLGAAPARAELSYVGSSTIGATIMPEATRTFTARTGIPFGIVEMQGSGKGIDLVARGAAPLAGSSRSLTAAEKKRAVRYQIIGYDALAIFVNSTNPVGALSREQLRDIFVGKVHNWKQVGGVNAPMVVITMPVAESRGQTVEFQEHVMDGLPYRSDRLEVAGGQPGQAEAVRARPHGIAVVSPSVATPGIKAVALEGTPPTPDNIRSGAYVLSRPLLLVAPARPSPEVRRFLEFILGAEGQAIVARHFVANPLAPQR